MSRETKLAAAQARTIRRKEQAELARKLSGLLTIDEFCAYVRISRSTYYEYVAKRLDGFPRPIQPFGRPLFKLSEVEAWRDSRELW